MPTWKPLPYGGKSQPKLVLKLHKEKSRGFFFHVHRDARLLKVAELESAASAIFEI